GGDLPAEAQRVGRRVALRHEQAEDAVLAECPDGERGDDGAVDAAGQADDDAAPVQPRPNLLVEETGDARARLGGIDGEDARTEVTHRSSSASLPSHL